MTCERFREIVFREASLIKGRLTAYAKKIRA